MRTQSATNFEVSHLSDKFAQNDVRAPLSSTTIPMSLALELAAICRSIYPGPTNQRGLTVFGKPLEGQKYVHGSLGRGFCRLLWNESHSIIAFRGTREMIDWPTANLRIWPKLITSKRGRTFVHGGFLGCLAYHDKTTGLPAAEAVLHHLREQELLERRMIITGHSLGGAMAMIFGAILENELPELVDGNLQAIVTFGSPATVLRGFSRAAQSARAIRFVNRNDLVTLVPLISYTHAATPIWLCGQRAKKMTLVRRIMEIAKNSGRGCLDDHKIRSYEDSILRYSQGQQ